MKVTVVCAKGVAPVRAVSFVKISARTLEIRHALFYPFYHQPFDFFVWMMFKVHQGTTPDVIFFTWGA
jgi:hypothetical protein